MHVGWLAFTPSLTLSNCKWRRCIQTDGLLLLPLPESYSFRSMQRDVITCRRERSGQPKASLLMSQDGLKGHVHCGAHRRHISLREVVPRFFLKAG